jgi:hypothetical protein
MRYFLTALAFLVLVSNVQAQLHFPQARADMGEVRSGVPLTQRFAYVNSGPHVIQITEAKATCGCLAPRLSQRVLKPGERGEVVLEVNTLTQPAGPHAWRIDVRYLDGDQPREASLIITGTVVTEVLVQPPALMLNADRAIRHEISVTDLRPQPLTVVGVRTSSPHLQANIGELTRNDAGRLVRKINLEVAADYPDGRHEEIVSLATDDPIYREFQVPVTVIKRTRQRLEATPAAVALTAPAGQPLPSRVVLIRDRDDEKVEVERIVTDDPALVYTWAEGPNNRATVKLSADRARITGKQFSSAVHVHVRKPVPAVVTIPVKCELQ